MSISDPLTKLQQSIRSINANNFNSPRMFTNAMVNAPEITTLIKDPTYDESSLYTISKPNITKGRSKFVDELIQGASMDVRSERIDGRTIYTLEPIVSDKPADSTFYQEEDKDKDYDYDVDDDDERDRRIPIVKFPNLNISNSTSRSLINLNSSSDLGQIFYQTSQVLSKYPNLIEDQPILVDQLNHFERQYRILEKEIQELGDEIKERKTYLTERHVNDNDATTFNVPLSSTSSIISTSDSYEEGDLDIDEIMRQERDEIEQLENRLKHSYN